MATFTLIVISFILSCNTFKPSGIKIETPANDTNILIPYYPLRNEKDLDVLINEIGDARVVLLGESTHGTHEFYQWRSTITKRLITEKGFQFIALEGDWIDTYKLNSFIKGPLKDQAASIEILKQYDRWPSSMWGNYEMAELTEWLNHYNQDRVSKEKTGIYGLDVYSFWEWTEHALPFEDQQLKKLVKEFKESFDSFHNDAMKYAAAVKTSGKNSGELTQKLWNYIKNYTASIPFNENVFLLRQFASLALEGEFYFRTMINGKTESWNIRENYMASTIRRLLELHGNNSKAIIWVHNGHAGDAGYSQMAEAGYLSIGQILKRQMGNKVFSVAFGSNKGAVYAGYYWNAPLQEIKVPPAKTGSWENILHEINTDNKVILSREIKNNKTLNRWLPFRSIGAAYSNDAIYGTALLPKRFDALIYIDSTTAIHPVR